MKKLIEKIKKHWIVSTSLTVLLVVILVAAYLGLNIWVKSLKLTAIDLTKDKIYTLSDTSKEQLKNIDQETTIYIMGLKDNTSLIDLINQYEKFSDKIKTERVDDLNTRPELKSKYGLEDSDSAVVVQAGENTKILSVYDFTTYDYTTGESIDVTEQKITNAIINVNVKEKPQIYFMAGHNEYGITTYLQALSTLLQEEANDTKTLNILTEGKIPDDCSVLAIVNPTKDFTEFETEKIIDYVNKGGKILWLAGPNFDGTTFTNAQKVLDLYGATLGDGIILEQDSSKMLLGTPNFFSPIVNASSPITKNIATDGSIILINATKIELKDTEELDKIDVTSNNLLTTGDKALYRTNLKNNTTSKIDTDEQGTFVVGTELTKQIDEKVESRLILLSSSEFATNETISLENQQTYPVLLANNKDLVANSLAALNEREDMITIRKNTETVTYTATQQQHYIIMAVIFIIPILIIIAGIIVWQVRRRKK